MTEQTRARPDPVAAALAVAGATAYARGFADALEAAAQATDREASDEWPIDHANRYAAAALRSASTAIRALKPGERAR